MPMGGEPGFSCFPGQICRWGEGRDFRDFVNFLNVRFHFCEIEFVLKTTVFPSCEIDILLIFKEGVSTDIAVLRPAVNAK